MVLYFIQYCLSTPHHAGPVFYGACNMLHNKCVCIVKIYTKVFIATQRADYMKLESYNILNFDLTHLPLGDAATIFN